MIITEEMKKAIELIETTNDIIYITGKAGTGKTTFLKYIAENTKKNIVITASTGVAAINAGGVTLHSFLNIPLNILDPNESIRQGIIDDKYEIMNKMDILVIDEISMIRPDIIDHVDQKLRIYRGNDVPFGGVQLILFGDLYQLPPVVTSDEEKIINQYYRAPYFFYARVFKRIGFHIVELNHIFRQSDPRFIEILNHIRSYQITQQDIEDLEELRNHKMSQNYDNKYIHICALKKDVHKINNELLGKPQSIFYASSTGNFDLQNAPCDKKLSLRIGARVMSLINYKNLYYNGSLGEVVAINDNYIKVAFDNGSVIDVEKFKWTSYEYKVVNGKVQPTPKGTCTQFPLTLAWAITIHKSQGLTFQRAVIHVQDVFCPGQLYVALSRCTSLQGIISDTFINKSHIIPNMELTRFEKAYKANNNFFNKEAYKLMRQ